MQSFALNCKQIYIQQLILLFREEVLGINKQKLQRQRKIALKRPATLDRLKRRGRRTATDVITKRFYGGKSKKGMSHAQKSRIEKRIATKHQSAMSRISKRLLPSKRKLDVARRQGKPRPKTPGMY